MLPLLVSKQPSGNSLDGTFVIKSPHDDKCSCFGYLCNHSFKHEIILFENQVVLFGFLLLILGLHLFFSWTSSTRPTADGALCVLDILRMPAASEK